jgi:multidrug resistance efflux pump
MQRSLMGLFLLALTLGLLALAAGSVRTTLEERWARESVSRPARERVFSVNVVQVTRTDVSPVITTYGEIRSRRTLDLRAPISGTIVELSPNFIEGGRIKAGELLVKLDPADAQSALDVSLTELTEANAELTESRAALELAHDELAAARTQAKLRQAALRRQENLLDRGVGTEAAVETAALALSAADQAVLAKRQALAQAEARVNRAGTALAKREIGLEEARRRLRNTEVFAEFDGVLSTVSVLQGGLIGTNERIGRLIDPSAIEVTFRLSSVQYARLVSANGGQATGDVKVRLDLFGEAVTAKGVIERVGAEVGDGQTGRQIFARLPAESAVTFRPGDFVSVEVVEPPLAQVAVLPATALDASGNVLMLGENERLEEVSVNILRRQGDTVILRARELYGREIVEARSPVLGAGIRVKPVRKDAVLPDAPETLELTPERRAKLIKYIESAPNLPQDVKDRIITRLNQDQVPVEMVTRIDSRMGG